jgi:23S rRNA (cytidine1920-2'-O)/16S rRNA (cytidine1409-2'-O)-methyltransferase
VGASDGNPFVSRGGLKLRHALDVFGVDVHGLTCADFGANVGGFTDCLLQAGASRVVAMDTGYGTLAWKLRQDSRVSVRERTNALHAPPPGEDARVDLVVMDMGWTPQRLCVPAALAWLKRGGGIITLVKPHYEVTAAEKSLLRDGVLPVDEATRIAQRVIDAMPSLGATVLAQTESPITGGKTKGNAEGNREWLALLERTATA